MGSAGWWVRSGPDEGSITGEDGSDEAGVRPVTLPTVDAPGSDSGETTVPAKGRVSLVTFFATWCHVCAEEMEVLRTIAADLPEPVQLVSVTNEPVGHAVTTAEIREWWRKHAGAWPVAYDPDLSLTGRLSVSGVPTLVVLDAENTVTWRHKGKASVETIRAEIAAARGQTNG
jgi:thiol-disulfide isomerase/thioredoxin